jgi:hypothetical protein
MALQLSDNILMRTPRGVVGRAVGAPAFCLLLLGLCSAACTEDDRPPPLGDPPRSARSVARSAIEARVEECGLPEDTAQISCGMLSLYEEYDALDCLVACYEAATCEEIEQYWPVFDCSSLCLGVPFDQFQCDDGTEVPTFVTCDTREDCPDGSDERGCVFFVCDGGELIWPGFLCDDYADCADGTDETLCSDAGRLTCDSGERVVPVEWVCDGAEDCTDGTDEAPCTSPVVG